MHMSGATRTSAPWHSHTQPSATGWAPIQMALLLSRKQAQQFLTHAVADVDGVAQPMLPLSATPTLSLPAGRRRRCGTRRLHFRLSLVVPLSLAFVLAFSCPNSVQTLSHRVEAISAVRISIVTGDLSMGSFLESLGDLPSQGRRSDLSLSLRGNSLRFSSASRELQEKRDDVVELLLSLGVRVS